MIARVTIWTDDGKCTEVSVDASEVHEYEELPFHSANVLRTRVIEDEQDRDGELEF